MGMARTALIGGNNEEALGYFNRVLESDPHVAEAWVGKGKAAGWQSTLARFRLDEAAIAFSHAIAAASPDEKSAITAEVIEESNRLVTALYGLGRNHLVEYVALNDTWASYLGQVSLMLDMLEKVRSWDPRSRTTLENIIHLCKDNIEGFSYRDPYNNNLPGLHGITPAYEQLLKGRMDQAVAALREIDPSYAAPAIDKKQADSCFVVTATMGDPYDPAVVLLRNFRDRWISKQWWGPLFIRSYYKIGPHVADVIRPRPLLRRVSLTCIVRPAVSFARRLLPTSDL